MDGNGPPPMRGNGPLSWSGWGDLNSRPLRPEANARGDVPASIRRLTCSAPSVGVPLRPLVSGAVVTHLVTHLSEGWNGNAASIVACCTSHDYGPAVPRTSRQLLGDYGESAV